MSPHNHRAVSGWFFLALVLSSQCACTTQGVLPEPNPIPSATISPTILATPTPSTVLPRPTPQPSELPAESPPVRQEHHEIIEGWVYDDNHQPLDGVQITVQSTHPDVPFFGSTETVNGKYQITQVPLGIQVKIMATKPGYTPRKTTDKTSIYKEDPTTPYRVDFGTPQTFARAYSASYNGLSSRPEIIQVYPSRNGIQVPADTLFTLKFSEPMDRQSVETGLSLRAYNPIKFSIDQRHLPVTFRGQENLREFQKNTPVWDNTAFDYTWNEDDTVVTLRFKEGKCLPSDKQAKVALSYHLSFINFAGEPVGITDKQGHTRKTAPFKLTDGDFEIGYKFEILPDTHAPRLNNLRLFYPLDSPPQLLLDFSEPLLIATASLSLSGGLGSGSLAQAQAPAGYPEISLGVTAAQAAQNYTLEVRDRQGKLTFSGTWAEIGGEAHYAPWDQSFRTVQLLPGPKIPPFESGNQLKITVSGWVVDPAGNSVDQNFRQADLIIP
ncbi:MAG: carboxypeptidase-like regulatory domain-containing protein [Candidatus Sericytochromatia bacterium]